MQEIKIIYITKVSKSSFCDSNDAYMFWGDIIITLVLIPPIAFKIVFLHHLLNISQKLIEQQQMMLKI